jgi:branched-chain amino acid transport system ATP-binding protein
MPLARIAALARDPKPMLELANISVRFGGLKALDDVTLRVNAGEIVGLVGPNGAGKTTLFDVISGSIRPGDGTLSLDGADLMSKPVYARARRTLGRTFQIPQPMQGLTVAENMRVAQRFGGGMVDVAAVAEILSLVGLDTLANRDAATGLSLTEMKALEIAKALATRPRVLLLDEVLAGLEAHGKRRFTRLLADIRTRYALTILIIEHDIETISTLCPRVAVLDFGRLIADGAPDAVFRDAVVVASYTGMDARA